MKKVILISLVALMTQACGQAPTPANQTLPSSALVKTVLACEIATTVPASTTPISINYTLETYQDGHVQINCQSPYPNYIINLTCLQTNPYNYSFQYSDNSLTLQTMNITISSTNTIQSHAIDSNSAGVTSQQACKTVTYPN